MQSDVSKYRESAEFADIIDARGKYVMPGGIDTHTHLDGMFMGQKTPDDFYRCSDLSLKAIMLPAIDLSAHILPYYCEAQTRL